MVAKFLNLNPDKQERIMNAAMKEFAQKGYEKASTNEIVKDAEISKGILFHYFKNKKEMFLFLFDRAVELMMEEFLAKLDAEERDLFVKWRQAAMLKLDLITRHPDLFDFLRVAYVEDAAEIKDDLKQRNHDLMSTGFNVMFSHIDTTKFKEGTDVERTLNIIFWTLEGFGARQQDRIKASPFTEVEMNELVSELDKYMEVLKQAFYK
ncbi:TetR/AcrR family transcriptional regulator [Paenibacillus terrigena]|uniref:TetR/AcrR family transcriptional regulator n=1 Tax=Paenibacillus terrigena TaxID=369333 RepID=UPI00037967B2|nr:TetR/AcrR family transcriptional regulator [Paenibacillus terrigena]